VKAWITLGDYAQVHAGKLYVVGGGVSITGTPAQLGVAIEIVLPWELRSRRQTFRIDLIDADQRPVTVPAPIAGVEPPPFQASGQFEGIPAPGLPPGSDLSFMLAFNVVGLPLQLASTYTLRLFIADEDKPSATKTFATHPQ